MSLQLTTKEFSAQAIDQARQQSLHSELLSMVSRNNSVISLTDEAETLLKLVDAQGATVLFNGESRSVGTTPNDLQVDALIQWLRSREETDVFATDSLPSEWPAADAFAAQASGLLAVTLSRFRGDDLLDSLLHFSRVGRMEINCQRINMDDVLSESLEMISQCRIDDGGVVDVPRPLPFVACDATRVREVFCNLIANGLKYNDANDRRIEVGYVDREDPGAAHPDPWVFYVRDNGIGIKSTFHDRIFQMFKRLHGQDLYGGGTGAGLTIVRKIVERHGGRVWLESEPGQGSTFYFTLQPENGQA